ncbi:DegT/DnrJ/EryC1/StrS family aminotransferase [Candidatus Pacearchaeota archaeon]|nr:DegT/DnrJ/EryC1/StrS family aminotransferase [Candidatus Pacearchaeota archaeon]
MVRHIELDAPNVSELEKQHLCRCIDSGFVSTFGPFISEFEQRFVEYLGVKKAVSTQSGTAAIHIALYELGIGARDEVIVPALTFIATINPILFDNFCNYSNEKYENTLS